ncbi:MAG: hypothetical protein ACM31D_00465 [Bacteroidota bacterium]
MADDSTRIGTSSVSTGLGQVRRVAGVGAPSSGDSGPVSVDGGGGASSPASNRSFGPRGSRMLPSNFPLDQLDRRAARGTYLDILV